MPLYPYQCEECYHSADEFQRMSEPHLTECPQCTGQQYRRQITLPHTNLVEFHRPIEMMSIALTHDDEIADFMRRNPSATISRDPNDPLYGVPLAHSRAEKLAILAKEGYQEAN